MYIFTLPHFLFSQAGINICKECQKGQAALQSIQPCGKDIGRTGGATLIGEDASSTDLKGRAGKKGGCCHESESPSQHGAEGLQ
jgi:hypothetical protein